MHGKVAIFPVYSENVTYRLQVRKTIAWYFNLGCKSWYFHVLLLLWICQILFFSLRQNSWKRTAFACSRLRLEWKLEPVGLGRWAQESIWKFLASGPSWPRTVVHKTLGCLGANKDLGTIGWLFRCEIYTVHDGAPPVISCFIHHSRYRLDIL